MLERNLHLRLVLAKRQNTVLLMCIICLAYFRIVFFMILVRFVVVLVYCFLRFVYGVCLHV